MEMMRHLTNLKKSSHENYDLKTVAILNDREVQEFRSIGVTTDQLNNEFNRLQRRKDELQARQTLFWTSIRRARPEIAEAEFLHIEKNADRFDIQTGPRKAYFENPFEGLFNE
jgi:hypothetical protein